MLSLKRQNHVCQHRKTTSDYPSLPSSSSCLNHRRKASLPLTTSLTTVTTDQYHAYFTRHTLLMGKTHLLTPCFFPSTFVILSFDLFLLRKNLYHNTIKNMICLITPSLSLPIVPPGICPRRGIHRGLFDLASVGDHVPISQTRVRCQRGDHSFKDV